MPVFGRTCLAPLGSASWSIRLMDELVGGFLALVVCAARTLEFSFTDGTAWHGPLMLEFEVPAKLRNQPMSFFNEVRNRVATCLHWKGCRVVQGSMKRGKGWRLHFSPCMVAAVQSCVCHGPLWQGAYPPPAVFLLVS